MTVCIPTNNHELATRPFTVLFVYVIVVVRVRALHLEKRERAVPVLQESVENMYATDSKFVAALCHGLAGLVGCRKPDGTPLVAGLKVTGFSHCEETDVGLAEKVPFVPETKLKELGALYEKGANWNSCVVVDGCLLTGQNPQSSEALAREVVRVLK